MILLADSVRGEVLTVPLAASEGSVAADSLGIAAPLIPVRVYVLLSGGSTLTVACWEAASAWVAGQNSVLFGNCQFSSDRRGLWCPAPDRGGVGDCTGGRRWVVAEVRSGAQPAEAHRLSPRVDPQVIKDNCGLLHRTLGRLVVAARPTTLSSDRRLTHRAETASQRQAPAAQAPATKAITTARADT